KKIISPEPFPPQEKAPPQNLAKREMNEPNPGENRKKSGRGNSKQKLLFAKNLVPDDVPAVIPARLQNPMDYYASGDYKNVVPAFDESQHLVSRGYEDKSLIEFYTHYYKALSYLAGNITSNALTE